MKKSTTRRALFLSFVSMFLCFTMLIGTTYAWFTDSVNSGINTIVAGNLDVELTHTNSKVADEDVEGKTNLFQIDKWEPGAVAYENFTVKNAGDLALKYQLSFNVANATVVNDAEGNPHSFTEMLQVAVVEDGIADTATRDDLKGLTNYADLSTFVLEGNLLNKNDTKTYGVVIYWQPSDNDNLFNINNGRTDGPVEAHIGINLFATQVEAERDSFDEFYDKDATMPKVTETVTAKAGEANTVSTSYGNVEFTTTTDTSATVEIEQTAVEEGNFQIESNEGAKVFEISVTDANGDDVPADFNIFVGKNLTGVGITHYGDNGTKEYGNTEFTYDPNTGYIAFGSDDYSPFVVTYKYGGGLGTEAVPYIIENAAQLKEAAKESANYVLAKNIAVEGVVEVPSGAKVVLDLNGKAITGLDNITASFGLFTNKGEFTIKDSVGGGKITLVATENRGWNAYSSVVSNNPGGKFTLVSGTLEHLGGTDMAYGIDNLTNGKGTYAETVINGGTVKSTYRAVRMFLNGIEAQNILTVNGGTIEGANKSIWMQDPSKNANTGTLTVSKNAVLKGDVYVFVTAGSTEFPATVSIADKALSGTSKIVEGNTEIVNKTITNVDGVWTLVDAYTVRTADELIAALKSGKNVLFANDIKMEAATTAPYGNKLGVEANGVVFDGNNKEFYVECYGDDYGIMTSGGTFKNMTIKEGCRAIMLMYATEDVIIDNVNIGGDGVLYPINTGEHGTVEGVNLVVTNSVLAGWTSYSGIESASFTNVEFKQGTYYNNIYGRVIKPYVNTTFEDCKFVEHMNLDLSALEAGHTITIKNCTVNGQAVTADVFTVPSADADYDTALFTVDLPAGRTIADCIIFE